MPISELRKRVDNELLDFVWNEWAQMGVFADPKVESPWAADPEALLLLTLEAGRSDARVFDETLDWLAVNAGLIRWYETQSGAVASTAIAGQL